MQTHVQSPLKIIKHERTRLECLSFIRLRKASMATSAGLSVLIIISSQSHAIDSTALKIKPSPHCKAFFSPTSARATAESATSLLVEIAAQASAFGFPPCDSWIKM